MKQQMLISVKNSVNDVLKCPRDVMSSIFDCEMREGLGLEEYRPELGEKEKLQENLAVSLQYACAHIAMYLEFLDLIETRRTLLGTWQSYSSEQLKQTEFWHTDENEGVTSEPLSCLESIYQALKILATDAPGKLTEEPAELKRLEFVLRCTAKIVRDANAKMTPSREHDVQCVMHNHLENVFEDYSRSVMIAKSIASFKADGGVISLQAAIEFKFCDSLNLVKTALRGINEDLSGYSGSKDWTRFYSVIYQTEPFITEAHFKRSLGLSGNAGQWTIIVVTGGKA